MILAPSRANPPRFRERELPGQGVMSGTTSHYDANSQLVSTQDWVADMTGYEYMYDSVGCRSQWNDVQHVRQEFRTDSASITTPQHCATDCAYYPPGGNHYSYDSPAYRAPELLQVQDILGHPQVQACLHKTLKSWHNSLYNMNNAHLPDVSVILMEDVPQLSGSLKVIIGLALKIAKYGQRLVDLDVMISKFKHQKMFTRVIVAQREAAQISKLYLGTEFALKQNLRTAEELAAGVARGASRLNTEREITSVREHTFLQLGKSPKCSSWPDISVQPNSHFENIKVTFCITTESKLSVRGSKLEQTLAKVMAKVGVLPQLASIWEATPYSWLIDYIFRTELLLNYVQRANEIGFSNVDIFRTSFSIHIERETTVRGGHYPPRFDCTQKYEYYERCIGADLNFPAILQWVKLPYGDQWLKAFAFFFSQFK